MKNTDLTLFHAWCQKVLPLVYDESLSYYEVLCKLTNYVNELIEEYVSADSTLNRHETEIQELQDMVENIQAELTAIANGEAEGMYTQALRNWIDKNLEKIVGRIVKYVVFGLTNDGYFCATIPHSWDFITFDTIADTNNDLYGHLILEW